MSSAGARRTDGILLMVICLLSKGFAGGYGARGLLDFSRQYAAADKRARKNYERVRCTRVIENDNNFVMIIIIIVLKQRPFLVRILLYDIVSHESR